MSLQIEKLKGYHFRYQAPWWQCDVGKAVPGHEKGTRLPQSDLHSLAVIFTSPRGNVANIQGHLRLLCQTNALQIKELAIALDHYVHLPHIFIELRLHIRFCSIFPSKWGCKETKRRVHPIWLARAQWCTGSVVLGHLSRFWCGLVLWHWLHHCDRLPYYCDSATGRIHTRLLFPLPHEGLGLVEVLLPPRLSLPN